MATAECKARMGRWMGARTPAQQPMPSRKPRASGTAYWAWRRLGESVRLYECKTQQDARELARMLGNSAADEAGYVELDMTVVEARREMRRRKWNNVEVIRRDVA